MLFLRLILLVRMAHQDRHWRHRTKEVQLPFDKTARGRKPVLIKVFPTILNLMGSRQFTGSALLFHLPTSHSKPLVLRAGLWHLHGSNSNTVFPDVSLLSTNHDQCFLTSVFLWEAVVVCRWLVNQLFSEL